VRLPTAEKVWWARLGRAIRPREAGGHPRSMDATHRRIVHDTLSLAAKGKGLEHPETAALWDELGEHFDLGKRPRDAEA
jgi:hypothetical protein